MNYVLPLFITFWINNRVIYSNIIGGLGSAVAEVLSENYPCIMKRIGLQDRYAESGKPEELYKKYGLDAESIAEEVIKFVSKKK